MIRREGRYSPSEWDWAPVGDHSLIPPPPFKMGLMLILIQLFVMIIL